MPPTTSLPSCSSSSSSKKRRFQVPITSYFSSSDSQAENGISSRHNYAAPTYTVQPTLPNKVQSSLLAVGMRVRKAVPEGYRTDLKKLHTPYPSKPVSVSTPSDISAPPYSELAPFSGILKVGNLAVQSFPQPTSTTTDDQIGPYSTTGRQLDEESIPPSSQESVDSTTFNPHKRAFEPDDDNIDAGGLGMDTFTSMDPSLLPSSMPSFPVTYQTSKQFPQPRTILHPKGGRLRAKNIKVSSTSPSLSKSKTCNHQTNLRPSTWGQGTRNTVGDAGGLDFEDAAFLKRREEVDEEFGRVGEIQMGGM